MSQINWLETLGWEEKELEDLKFVGYSYINYGAYKIAKAFFEALVILDPKDAYNLQTLGALYLEAGEYLLALNYLERAIHIEPNDEVTLLNRIKALLSLGYQDQAVIQAKKIATTAPPELASQAEAIILAYK